MAPKHSTKKTTLFDRNITTYYENNYDDDIRQVCTTNHDAPDILPTIDCSLESTRKILY